MRQFGKMGAVIECIQVIQEYLKLSYQVFFMSGNLRVVPALLNKCMLSGQARNGHKT